MIWLLCFSHGGGRLIKTFTGPYCTSELQGDRLCTSKWIPEGLLLSAYTAGRELSYSLAESVRVKAPPLKGGGFSWSTASQLHASSPIDKASSRPRSILSCISMYWRLLHLSHCRCWRRSIREPTDDVPRTDGRFSILAHYLPG